MKQFISLVLLLVVTSCGSTKNPTQPELKTSLAPIVKIADISIEGMACQEGCADAIQANLIKLEGVNAALVKYESGKATIEFDSSKVSSKEIQKAITETKVKDYSYTIKDIIITSKE